MSNLRKWINLVESVPAELAGQPPRKVMFKKDATVMVAPRVGGGLGRFMEYTPNGAMIDIKGVARELAHDDFSAPERDYGEPLAKGNDWFHASLQPDTVGSLKDKPEFRPGDMVKVADVYGSVIGPGYGVFVAYSTSGNECIVNFDDKEISVPTSSVGAVLEQNAKDNFSQTDNDGALSPMSLGSENVKVDVSEPQVNININGTNQMDNRDEFSKWMSAIEEALAKESGAVEESASCNMQECGCGNWDCQVCFPDQEMGMQPMAQGPECCAMCGHPVHGDEMCSPEKGMEFSMPVEEEDMDFNVAGHEKPASGKGVKLGDIVQKYVPADEKGEESPLTHGGDNLSEEHPEEEWEPGYSELVGKILYMQDMGLSKAPRHYTKFELEILPRAEQKKVYQEVMGEVAEDDMPMMNDEDGMAQSPTGMAPTMPEGTIMENVDKDVAAMLSSLKKLDQLKESVAPVLEKKAKPDFLDMDKDGDKKEPMKKAIKDKEEKVDEDSHLKNGKKSKWSDDPKDHFKEEKVDESADQEVISWMKRFAKLGK